MITLVLINNRAYDVFNNLVRMNGSDQYCLHSLDYNNIIEFQSVGNQKGSVLLHCKFIFSLWSNHQKILKTFAILQCSYNIIHCIGEEA